MVMYVLYLIVYSFYLRRAENNPFFEALDSLGTCRELGDGAIFIDCAFTAVGLRRRLVCYCGKQDTLFITKVFEGHCGGMLPTESLKRFVSTRWAFNPFPPPEFKGYYSF